MSEIFAHDELAFLLLLPPGYLVLQFWSQSRRRALLEDLLTRRLLDGMVVGFSPGRRVLKTILVTLALTALVLALMRPQWGRRSVEVQRRGIDLVFVVDTSKSMLARDVQPSRIDRVKQELSWFVDHRLEDDRIALVAFAGSARTLCPLTLDRPAFDIFLGDLDVGVIPEGGTDLDAALSEALATFDDDERNHKAILVFSDGEAHAGVPERAIERANARGVRIYCVGVGGSEGVRIPIRDERGNDTYLRDGEGNIVTTRLEEDVLRAIAARGDGGAYVDLTRGGDNLTKIYAANIKSIENKELASARSERRIDRFPWFLGAALVLLALEFLIAEGRSRRREGEGRS
ncbi:MAG: VWA domain-containing protein [Planctomycetes bacterium]|nr:VWA domain-containing protein [Planctomycetota bacterium]